MKLLPQLRNFTRSNSLIAVALATVAWSQDLMDNTLETGKNLFTPGPLSIIAAGAGGSYFAFKAEDQEGYRSFLPEKPFDAVDKASNFVFGEALPVSALSLWIAGRLSDSDQIEATGEEMCRGLFYTYGIVQTLKLTTGRARPDGSNHRSFPSAHAAGAACTAAILWNRYGEEVGIPLSVLALYTCFSRVNLEKHFPSDVIMGAAIGTACGIASSMVASNEEGKSISFSFSLSINTQGRITPGIW